MKATGEIYFSPFIQESSLVSSGYKDNTLVFDGVDDSLTIPELVLDETAMTVMHDGKLYAYEDDKVFTVGEDGEIVGSGKNLLLDSKLLITSDEYNIHNLDTATKIPHGTPMTLTIKAKLGSDRTGFMFFNNQGVTDYRLVAIPKKDDNFYTYSVDFNWIEYTKDRLRVFQMPNTGTSESSIEWVKLEKRNPKPLYSPSPKDYKTTTLSPASLTDLQLYNKTLRKDELLHNAESKGLKKLKPDVVVQDGLILHYDFSHESNASEYKGKAFDYSGNGNHGELQNFNFTEESGYNENKLAFDGVDDYIETEKVPFNKSLTIESIVNLESATSYAPLLRLSPKENLSIGLIYFGVSNNFVENSPHYMLWAGTRGDSGVVQHMSIGTFIPNQIYHLSCVLDVENKTLSIYSDGQLISSLEHDIIPIEDNETTLHVGRQHSTDRIFKGKYFSAKIYNRPLTPEEIAHNYQIEKEKFNIIEGEM